MTDIHKLMYGNEEDRKLWREAGAPLHDLSIEPRFYAGSIVLRKDYEGTYQIIRRRIAVEGAVSYDLRPVQVVKTTAREMLLAQHKQDVQEAASRGTPHHPKAQLLGHAALQKAPGLSEEIVLDITILDESPVWEISEAELSPFMQNQLSLGKAKYPKAASEKLKLKEAASARPVEQ